MGKGKTGSPPLSPAPGADDEERRLFEHELAGVRPLRPGPSRVALMPSAPPSRPSLRGRAPSGARAAMVVEREGGRITAAAFGVSHATLHELARGGFRAEATCDLHGLRAEPARLRLRAFIAESSARGRRAVLVICGRGLHSGPQGPVLLDLAVEALTQPPSVEHVQALVSAAPPQGGQGALMVLLRHSARR